MVASAIAAVRSESTTRLSAVLTSHFLGLSAGAAVLAAILAAIGALLFPENSRSAEALVLAIGAAAVAWGLAALVRRPLPVPSSSSQVPRAWRYLLSPRTYFFAYGVGLGMGFLTKVSTLSLHVCAGVAMIAGNPWLAVLILQAYAVGRGIPVVLQAPGDRSTLGIPRRDDRAFRAADSLLLIALGTGLLVTGGAS